MINYLNLLHQSTPEIQGKLRTLENLHLKKWSLIFKKVKKIEFRGRTFAVRVTERFERIDILSDLNT